MKKFVLMLLAILLVGVQFGYAQKSQRSDADLLKAEDLFAQKDVEGAFNCVNKFLADYPKTSDGYFLRAKIYRKQGKSSEAIADLNRALEYRTKEDQKPKYLIYWWRATVYNDMEEYDKAIADYTAAYKLIKNQDNSHVSSILMDRADAYAAKQDYKKELDNYFLMLKYNEKDQMAMAGIARLFLRYEQYEKVVEASNHSENHNPDYEEIYRFRMQAYDKLGNKTAAIDDAIKYLRTSDNPNMGIVYDILKQHPRYALACVSQLCNMDESNIRWKLLQIDLHEANNDYIAAIKKYNSLEREHGARVYIYERRSLCYNAIGQVDKAIDDVTAGLSLAGRDELADLLFKRATYYMGAGLYDEAIADLNVAIEKEPMQGVLYSLRGSCYSFKKDYKAALKEYNMSIDLDKTDALAWVKRGRVLRRLGQLEEANKSFKHVLEIDRTATSGSVRYYALLFLGDRLAAFEWIDKVIASDPENSDLYYDKACMHSLSKDAGAAIAALRIAFEKGYRSFAHIEHDEDMNNIRNHKDFIALINEYKSKPIVVEDNVAVVAPNDDIPDYFEIPMKKSNGGTYEVACQINNVPLRLIFDTGAANVTISLSEALFMLKNGYLIDADVKGKVYHSVASGEVVEGTRVLLREIRIGAAVLRDVEASVVHNQEAPLLLGQSVLERFGTVTIDNANSKIVIRK